MGRPKSTDLVVEAEQDAGRRPGTAFIAVEDAPGPGMHRRARELVGLLSCALCLYILLSLATFELADVDGVVPRDGVNRGGLVGYWLALGLVFVFGAASYPLVLLLLAMAFAPLTGRTLDNLSVKAVGALVFSAMVAVLFAGPDGGSDPWRLWPYGMGGRFGDHLSPRLDYAFGGSGRMLVVLFGALLAFLLATGWMLTTLIEQMATVFARGMLFARERSSQAFAFAGGASAVVEPEAVAEPPEPEPVPTPRRRRSRRRRRQDSEELEAEAAVDGELQEPEAEEPAAEEVAADDVGAPSGSAADSEPDGSDSEPTAVDEPSEPDVSAEEALEPVAVPSRRKKRMKVAAGRRRRTKSAAGSEPPLQPSLPFAEPYPFPPVELFSEPESDDSDVTRHALDANKEAIERRLASFKIDAEVVAASVGPAVTQYEVALAEGIRVTKIASYEADLSAALKAVTVRVVAPIPGKDTVGVEVPNESRQTVLLRELLEGTEREQIDRMAIPLFLGKDVRGAPLVEDLARMPHLLIAGTTGSGKSVCINVILLSILMLRTPQQVQLILIDPKMVELQAYKAIPHLSCAVVTNMKRAPGVLEWAVEEMERRYELLSRAGVNHIRSYNKLGVEVLTERLGAPPEPNDAHLPYVVLVIDELADLLINARNEVEDSIQRLAQKSRAVGLHVILATQRPSTDVITGVIKANLPCQIAFKVNRKVDSRVILDANGAEKLLGHGDMLYVPPGSQGLVRAQGTFVAEEEIHKVVQFLEENGPKPRFIPDLVQTETGSRRKPQDRDDLFDQAVEIILGQQRGSATLLQRTLSVGYTRATRLLEMMEVDGIVGPFAGSKSREVLLTLDEWREREEAFAEAMDDVEAGDGAVLDDESGEEAEDEDFAAMAGEDEAGLEDAAEEESAEGEDA